MALTTLDIERKLGKYHQFAGVYSIDKLPFWLVYKPCGFVVNLDPSWKPGSHWVAIFMQEIGPVIYFDSFGLSPPQLIITFIERNCKKYGYQYNRNVYQGNLSIKCGHFCIFFLESCFNNMNFSLLKCRTNTNEKILNGFYK